MLRHELRIKVGLKQEIKAIIRYQEKCKYIWNKYRNKVFHKMLKERNKSIPNKMIKRSKRLSKNKRKEAMAKAKIHGSNTIRRRGNKGKAIKYNEQ